MLQYLSSCHIERSKNIIYCTVCKNVCTVDTKHCLFPRSTHKIFFVIVFLLIACSEALFPCLKWGSKYLEERSSVFDIFKNFFLCANVRLLRSLKKSRARFFLLRAGSRGGTKHFRNKLALIWTSAKCENFHYFIVSSAQ